MSDTVRVTVYPRKGASIPVPTPDSAPLPTTGAIVDLTEYILELLRDGDLLTYDPLSIGGGPPDYLPIPTGGSVSSVTLTALSALASSTTGGLSATYGATAVLDGPEGIWLRDPSSTETADNGLVTGSGTGRWKRVRDRNFINVKWYGAKGDGVTDDTAAIQAAFNAGASSPGLQMYPGCEVYFPPGLYNISAPLKIKRAIVGGGTLNEGESIIIRGANAPCTGNHATFLIWTGSSTTNPLLWLIGNNFVVSNLTIRAGDNKTLYSAIEAGSDTASAVSITNCQFRGITISGTNTSVVQYGITMGSKFPQLSNLENFVFEDCKFDNMYYHAVFIRSGQPINTSFFRCHFNGSSWTDAGWGGKLRMRGVLNQAASTTIELLHCDFQSLEIGVEIENCYTLTVIRGGESENCKKMFYCAFLAVGVPGTTIMSGLRCSPLKVNVATNIFSAGDLNYIYQYTAGHILIEGCHFVSDPSSSPQAKIAYGQSVSVISRNNDWATATPFAPFPDYRGTVTGGVWSTGDKYYVGDGSELVSLPSLNGSVNPSGTVTFNSGEAIKSVVLPVNEYATDYKVRFDLESVTGSVVTGSLVPFISAKASTGFDINLPVAPSGGTVTIRYTLWR